MTLSYFIYLTVAIAVGDALGRFIMFPFKHYFMKKKIAKIHSCRQEIREIHGQLIDRLFIHSRKLEKLQDMKLERTELEIERDFSHRLPKP